MSDNLGAIRARTEAAAPGPWRVVEEHGRDIADEAYSRITIQSEAGDRNDVAELIGDDFANGSDRPSENAEFIAHAREDIPALLALVDHLERLAEELESEGSTDQLDSAFRIREVLAGRYEVHAAGVSS